MSTPATSCLIEIQYIPCIAYLHCFFKYETVYIERHENYQKGSYRNRCHIASPHGLQVLSVPLLKGKHQQTPAAEVRIAYHTPWYAQQWHAIETAYGSAPFFTHYAENIREFLYAQYEKLFDLNFAILKWMLTQCQAPGSLQMTTSYSTDIVSDQKDLRNTIIPKDEFEIPPYQQVFTDRLGFLPNLSGLDLFMHFGPETHHYLSRW